MSPKCRWQGVQEMDQNTAARARTLERAQAKYDEQSEHRPEINWLQSPLRMASDDIRAVSLEYDDSRSFRAHAASGSIMLGETGKNATSLRDHAHFGRMLRTDLLPDPPSCCATDDTSLTRGSEKSARILFEHQSDGGASGMKGRFDFSGSMGEAESLLGEKGTWTDSNAEKMREEELAREAAREQEIARLEEELRCGDRHDFRHEIKNQGPRRKSLLQCL